MFIAPETQLDGYKIDHRNQYPKRTQVIASNLTPRGTRRKNVNKVVFFGLQYFLKEYIIRQWNENFFKQPKEKVLFRFERRIRNYLGPNKVGTSHIAALHDLGYLPISVYALPEGTVCGLRIPSLLIFNTKDEFFWLTNYLETILSTTVWGPCTSATTAFEYKKLLTRYAMETVGDASFVPWQGHDFSFRGMYGMEAALMSGAAHATSFTGSDTVPVADWFEMYYGADSDKEIVIGSVAATEHSVACSTILNFVEKIRIESDGSIVNDDLMNLADIEYVKHLITEVYPDGIVSIVADSFDYWNTITNTARALRDIIMARNGKVVFRPDTGDPVKIVCGDDHGKTDAERMGSIACLWEIFGGTVTKQGYRLLDSHVGLIYGDSITLDRAEQICEGLKRKGFASINVVYGIGSYTYQYVTRDTDQYAVKATFAKVDGKNIDIFKRPKTGDGMKNSATGLVAVFKDNTGEFYLKDRATWDEVKNCELKHVFCDGKLLIDYKLSEIRNRLASYL